MSDTFSNKYFHVLIIIIRRYQVSVIFESLKQRKPAEVLPSFFIGDSMSELIDGHGSAGSRAKSDATEQSDATAEIRTRV